MSSYDYLHEAEDVWLVPERPLRCAELRSKLLNVGLTLDDDVFVLDRDGKIPLWQSRSIASVHVFFGNEEVFEEDASWDRLRIRYFMATVPAECFPSFVDVVSRVSPELGIPMTYRGAFVTPLVLAEEFRKCLGELQEAVGEPGSKEVAAEIEMTYPRRGP